MRESIFIYEMWFVWYKHTLGRISASIYIPTYIHTSPPKPLKEYSIMFKLLKLSDTHNFLPYCFCMYCSNQTSNWVRVHGQVFTSLICNLITHNHQSIKYLLLCNIHVSQHHLTWWTWCGWWKQSGLLSWYSNRLQAGLLGFDSCHSKIFSSPLHPYHLWGTPSLLSNGFQGLFPQR
jgi:hypothetical protein